MNAVDGSDHFDKPSSHEQSPSLLTIILDTNPAAWSLLSSTLPFSSAIANLLVYINAHLAANYTNKVAVVASHCDKATWLYPSPTEQKPPPPPPPSPPPPAGSSDQPQHPPTTSKTPHEHSESTPRLKLNFNSNSNSHGQANSSPARPSSETGNKYRPFRLVEEELLHNLTALLSSTSAESVSRSPTTMIAGALTLALSHINRESISYAESVVGITTSTTATSTAAGADTTANTASGESSNANSLQSRILLISVSPSTDLAHQYIPIMNSIFACQRLSIPIDILQLPVPSRSRSPSDHHRQQSKSNTSTGNNAGSISPSPSQSSSNSTVFLQQAADATHGIFIAAQLPPASPSGSSSISTTKASQAFLTYLLASLLPSPSTRSTHLILPTRIDVDFRAACFCHRNVVSIGFVCSICLSIFCSVPDNGDCLTCGTHLSLGQYGARPVVVAKKPKRKQPQAAAGKG